MVHEHTIFRPRTCDIDATVGWIIVEAKRNPVPDQNASKALPPSSALIMGSAVGRLVESMATAAMMVNSDMNARRNRLVGFQPSPLPEPLAATSPTAGAATGAWMGRGFGDASSIVVRDHSKCKETKMSRNGAIFRQFSGRVSRSSSRKMDRYSVPLTCIPCRIHRSKTLLAGQESWKKH